MRLMQSWPEDDVAFWDAAAEGRLVLEGNESSGYGTVKAVSAEGSVNLAEVQLDDGPRVTGAVVGKGAASASPGDRVRTVYEALGHGRNRPCFHLDFA